MDGIYTPIVDWEELIKYFEWPGSSYDLLEVLHTLSSVIITSYDNKTLPDGTIQSMTIRQPLIGLDIVYDVDPPDDEHKSSVQAVGGEGVYSHGNKAVKIAIVPVAIKDLAFKIYQTRDKGK